MTGISITARRSPGPRDLVPNLLVGLAGIGLGITVGLALTAQSAGSLAAPGGVASALGRFAGLTGAYLMLILVLLIGRLPFLERVVGQGRLVRWHRLVAPWALTLILAHAVLITVGYAAVANSGALAQIRDLITTYPGILAAVVGLVLLTTAAVTSHRIARRRMSYETWWAVHLYTYLGLALSFSHQIATGASFVGHPVATAWWTALWLGTAGVVLAFRLLLPLSRSFRHRLRVVSVHDEGPGVVSILCEGRWLDRLAVSGGQFFQWRFLQRGLWWQAHPYSISAMPNPPYIRVTVKDLGDHSGGLAEIKPGTHVAIEGPYGSFTPEARSGDAVVLVGAGVGTTPIRALIEDLPEEVGVVVILRGSSPDSIPLRNEIAELVEERDGLLHELIGPREHVRLDGARLRELVPDIRRRDLYVCGPGGFTAAVRRAASDCGLGEERIHDEGFAFQ
jgi:predicted ferric reductase